MNFIKQIESSLRIINQARFQDLINHLLHIKGYKFIGAPGSVVSKEKTSKGAPDSFFENGDKYIFMECTTQEKLGNSKTFLKKLLSDVEHCFDEEKTGIDKNNIEQLILACTEKITPAEFQQLKDKVNGFNPETKLEVYNIQNLPMNIYDFPGLSEEYLGVQIIKGEIYNLPDFLIKTTKGLQPSLINEFVGREDELKQSIQNLQSVDILLLSGGAGVGKTKLAIALLEEFSKTGFIPIVIQSTAVPLWDDFIHLFQNGKDYIILFDDANKSVQNLTYLLDFIQKSKTYKLKVIITSRDYVKQQISQRLSNSRYKEVVVGNLKDKEIEEIIVKALPNLQYHRDIKRKIIDLAKGNARVALMATYSVTPDSETNYLTSPVKLYEKYFEKISEEIETFSNPIMLQALAIVSFFGVLERANSNLAKILKEEFDIDWDELWSTILKLHSHEILDVYTNEIAKVSDQVLSTYAFYKCFIDEKTALIPYDKWIATFIQSHQHRIKSTLIDVNNTFNYPHVRDLVLPHLEKVISIEEDEELLYSFHTVFWFYRGYDTLIYLTSWIKQLPKEVKIGDLNFTYVHNDHTRPTKYFELLINFWNHSNELLQPAINLGLDLVERQPTRLPEVLKFVHDYFSYKWEDVETGYRRQNILCDTLLTTNISTERTKLAQGIFLNIIETLLGWHFTEFGSTKGSTLTIYNFDLYNSPELLNLRCKILEGFYSLFDNSEEQTQKILETIVYPRGDIDKQIYVSELPIYRKLITQKFSVHKYAHCKFVKRLAKIITDSNTEYPAEWEKFIDSDVIRLSKFLKTEWDDNRGKTIQEREVEKREDFKSFISSKSWIEIEVLLYSINDLYKQQSNSNRWFIHSAISEIFIAIANKSKEEINKAFKMFFSDQLSVHLEVRVVYYCLNQNILSGKELLSLMNEYEFEGKSFWITSLLNALPENQIEETFLLLLIQTFEESSTPLPINRMSDLIKYQPTFEQYINNHPSQSFKNHNIVTYLTKILLSKEEKNISLGFHFCQECSKYFTQQLPLLKQAFSYLKKWEMHFDYDGKELEAILTLDSNFFIEYLEQRVIDFDFLTFRFEDFKLDYIWSLPNYKEIINKSLNIIVSKVPVFSNMEHPSTVLFTFKSADDDLLAKSYALIEEYIKENYSERQRILMILNVVLHRFGNRFIDFLEKTLLLNKDIDLFKRIYFNKGGTYSGSRVPIIQREIDLCKEIMIMIKTLPNVLDYAVHLGYLEQTIVWLKKDIDNEQRRDFQENYE